LKKCLKLLTITKKTDIMPEPGQVHYPFGEADVVELTATGAQAITIVNQKTIIDGVTVQATADRTLNLTVDANSVRKGAVIELRTKTAATENTIFGDAIDGTTYAGVAGKTITRTFSYDGSVFTADDQQID
jgi:hypothetical protein